MIIIGAGPAGMAAARRVAENGLSVLLLDEQQAAGGQIYRDVDRAATLRGHLLGEDFVEGRNLTSGLAHPGIRHIKGAIVWHLDAAPSVSFTVMGHAEEAIGKRLVIATGALERPMPIEGWTLPGVMTAGAAQILLKQSGIVPTEAVLIGCGPLLYLVAAQMCRAGSPPKALIETQTGRDLLRSSRFLRGALGAPSYLAKGVRMLQELRRAGVTRHAGASGIRITDIAGAKRVEFRIGSARHQIECRTVLLHHGVIPNTQATRLLDLAHVWDTRQQAFRPQTDRWGRSSSNAVFVVGDGAGIAGAKAAALAGQLAALEIANDLGTLKGGDRDARARPIHRALAREQAIRPFLDTAFPPFAEALLPPDPVMVCRCEEVRAGSIREAARLGCLGLNQAKSFSRAGMGPCQGRFCGPTVTAILAAEIGRAPQDIGSYRIRPPLKPILLGDLAGLSEPKKPQVSHDRTD